MPEDAVEIVSEEIEVPTETLEEIAEEVSPKEVEIAPVSETNQHSGIFFPMVIGGVISAAIGFGAAHYFIPGGVFFPGENQELVEIHAEIAELKENSANNLMVFNAANELARTQSDEFSSQQSKFDDALTQSTADVTARLVEIENRPIADASAEVQTALKSYVTELARMNEVVASQGSEIAGFQSRVAELEDQLADKLATVSEQKGEAETAAKNARLRSLFNELKGELDTGRAFADTLTAINDVSGNMAPTSLSENSAGIPSLSSLQTDFPDIARATLAVAIAETADPSAMGRFSAFLKSQTGARSLTAKEGDDPDAILSRAEAALNNGEVQASIDELAGLPEGGTAEIAPWVAKAQAYADAQSGFATYTTTTLSN
ncbi:hypothetical protein RB2150_12071 [Rhodobacteraceae bacterium HTCC2150]|nr:hypothetical protein RB2150_12071 [Rhodobacteraceae bacterium HTCC2150]